jgi:hypothetical protein
MTTEQEAQVENLKRMIASCFTYGGASRTNYNFARYILPYKDKMDATLFERTYADYLAELESDYVIEHNTFTDHEGCTYNTLMKKGE